MALRISVVLAVNLPRYYRLAYMGVAMKKFNLFLYVQESPLATRKPADYGHVVVGGTALR
jgi:hypothetical protein